VRPSEVFNKEGMEREMESEKCMEGVSGCRDERLCGGNGLYK
jgi:hypothetical protein